MTNPVKKNLVHAKTTATDKSHLTKKNQALEQQPVQADDTLQSQPIKNSDSINQYEMFDNMGIGGELL